MINRMLTQEIKNSKKSVLLLGPRQVGKSTLVQSIKPDLEINLANELEFLKYSSIPESLNQIIDDNSPKTVFIDEIQRCPKLLNSIQVILDKNKNIKFYLTGSSARKLKRGGSNLLPGRIVNFSLGPVVSSELDYKMDITKALEFGTLPEVYLSKNEKENIRILKSYAANYLKEEIKAEALVRNLDSFARFLQEVTLNNSLFVDYTKLAKNSKISRHAIPRYFEILEDTLVGYRLFPFLDESHQLDLIKHPKFYFFDCGVYNGLLGNFKASLDRIGTLSEQLVFTQILHSAWSKEIDLKMYSFRERGGVEVDFIVKLGTETLAIEVKNSDQISSDDLKGLKYFDEQTPNLKKQLYIFNFGKLEQKRGKIWSLPWQKGLKEIGL